MSDILDNLFNQLAPPKEEIAEKPSKSLLERLWDSFDRVPSPTPVKPPVEAVKAPVAPLPNDPDGFWTNLKQKWHTEAPQRQAEIARIKQTELGEGLNEAVMNLEKALSKKNINGTVRSILRTEYRDLTGKEYNARSREIK